MKPEPNLILSALKLLDNTSTNQGMVKEGKIENKYKGYVASFGGSVVQMGIMPACMAFCADDNKKKVAELMFSIFKEVYLPNSDLKGLESYLIDNWREWGEGERKTFRMKFTKAAVSLKMAMRTFEFDKENSSD
jgi:hypothetical protein